MNPVSARGAPGLNSPAALIKRELTSQVNRWPGCRLSQPVTGSPVTAELSGLPSCSNSEQATGKQGGTTEEPFVPDLGEGFLFVTAKDGKEESRI